jgi:DNA modification methylase
MPSKALYANIKPEKYVEWFDPIARGIFSALKPKGSFVLNIDTFIEDGVLNFYIWDLLRHLVKDVGFILNMDYVWLKPTVMPTGNANRYIAPRRAFEYVWHLSKTNRPKIDTRNVLMKYGKGTYDQMKELRDRQMGGRKIFAPSGHNWVPERMLKDRGGSTPMNVIVCAHTDSCSEHMEKWKETGTVIHPARYPENLVEYFVLSFTDPKDLVCDCFAGSGTTLAVARRLDRRYIGCDVSPEYVKAAEIRLSTVTHVVSRHKTRIMKLDDDYLPDEGEFLHGWKDARPTG